MTTSTSLAAQPYRGSASMTTLALLSEKGGAGKSLAAEGLLAVGAARACVPWPWTWMGARP